MSEQKALYRKGFTLVELLVVISIIAILLALLIPALTAARDQSKKVICMSNTKQLTNGWLAYATANDGKLVFAGTTRVVRTGSQRLTKQITSHHPESSWVFCPQYEGVDKAPAWFWKISGYEWYQDECIRMGVLYPTIRSLKAYRCPAATATDNSRSYAISSYMNGYCSGDASSDDDSSATPSQETDARRKNLVKKLSDIKQTSGRLVFICQGGISLKADGTVRNYGYECYSPFLTNRVWRDIPPAIHMKRTGTCLSFADGHTEYWKWIRSSVYSRLNYDGRAEGVRPADDEDFTKLYKVIWPKVMY